MANTFEWHSDKAASNLAKHRVSFVEAATVFANPLAAIFSDHLHSDDETRELIIGHSAKNRLLIVSFVQRGNSIRNISVSRTTRRERSDYEERPKPRE